MINCHARDLMVRAIDHGAPGQRRSEPVNQSRFDHL